MRPCNCPACDRESYPPLPCEKWNVGQRVKFFYHTPEGESVENHGVIIKRPEYMLDIKEAAGIAGILIKPDHPLVRTFWTWDFSIAHGIGYSSAILEE